MELDLASLYSIVQGQAERNIMESSMSEYLCRCRTMTNILSKHDSLRRMALELDSNGNPISHTGLAHGVFKLKMPMSVESAKLLFGLLSVDTSLPNRRKRNRPQ